MAEEDSQDPWGLAFLPDGRLLVTELRGGRASLRRTATCPSRSPATRMLAQGQGGLLDVALDPDFARTGSSIFFAEPGEGGPGPRWRAAGWARTASRASKSSSARSRRCRRPPFRRAHRVLAVRQAVPDIGRALQVRAGAGPLGPSRQDRAPQPDGSVPPTIRSSVRASCPRSGPTGTATAAPLSTETGALWKTS